MNWYEKLNSVIKWNDRISNNFVISSGVRQGGILSPILFAIYVDDLMIKLQNSKVGCFIKYLCCNSFMYADDLVLISITIQDLQSLINTSVKELSSIGLSINTSKTFCIRIGPRHTIKPTRVLINSKTIDWVNELCYLGVTIVSSKNFKLNLQNRKQKYFRALNAIFGRVGTSNAPSVAISLAEAYCVPILLYGSECTEHSKSTLKSLENAYSQLYNKLFHTYDNVIIKQCQYYSRQLPIEFKIASRRYNFLKNMSSIDNIYCKYLDINNDELLTLLNTYCCVNDSGTCNIDIVSDDVLRLQNIDWNGILWKYFEKSMNKLV